MIEHRSAFHSPMKAKSADFSGHLIIRIKSLL
ncbi:hypothetical protein PUN4_780043 [Paraburkholderia unamae]|nr:hypothetical protein PUN4_780043 [Paraburkholderia unamae]